MSDSEGQEKAIDVQADSEVEVSTEPARGRRRRSRSVADENSVNMDELRELIQLVRENEFTEFELEREGFRVRFRRGSEVSEADAAGGSGSHESPVAMTAGPAALETPVATSAPSHPGAKAQTAASEDQDLHIITSPIVGTFYRAASPQADSFVRIGSRVESDTVVCIIEAMKLM